MKKRLLIMLLVLTMVLFVTPSYTSATETDSYVAKIGQNGYTSFADAMAAAKDMTGAVTVEIYGAVEFVNGMELQGSFDSISFEGKEDDAKITINQSAGGDYLEAHGKIVSFTGLTLAKANPAWSGNSGHMGNYFSIQGGTVTYTNCVFPNGACTSTGTAIYNSCTFQNTSEYGLWVYDDALVTVNGGTIDSKKGIKVYSEGEDSVTSTLTVENATFTASVTGKPAVAIGYAESITLKGNIYNNTTGVLELDSGSDADCEGITFVAQDAAGNDISKTLTAVDRSNGNAACGVLVDGKIYTTVTAAVEEVETGDTVTLLYDVPATEEVKLPMGVKLETNNHEAPKVSETVPVARIGTTDYATLAEAIAVGGEVKVLTDVTLTEQVVIDKDVTITADQPVTITVSIANGSTGAAFGGLHVTSGTLTLGENLTVTNVNSAQNGVSTVTATGTEAKVVVNGAVVKSECKNNAIEAANGSYVTIESGHVYGQAYTAAYASGGATIEVKGGKVGHADYNFYGLIASKTAATTGGNIIISGGEVRHVLAHEDANSNVTITGGTVTGSVGTKNDATMTITGGTFTTDVSSYLADGYKLTTSTDADGNTVYGVAELPKFTTSLTLNETLDMNFYIPVEKVGENATFKAYINNEEVNVTVVTMDGRYRVRYSFQAHEMTQEITVKCFVNGEVVAERSMSIQSYAMLVLDAYDDAVNGTGTEAEEAKLNCALSVAVLDYGSLAQIGKGTYASGLANANLTDAHRAIYNSFDWNKYSPN